MGIAAALDEAAGPAEWMFGSVLCLSALGGLHLAIGAARRALAERGRDRHLAAMSPDHTVRQAVLAERARLAADVQMVIRSAVLGMADSARLAACTWEQDPAPALAPVQAQGQTAVQELRRLLGLLRSAAAEPAPPPAPPAPAAHGHRSDLALALGTALLAGVEQYVAVRLPDVGLTAGDESLLLGCAAAAAVGLRRRAPGWGALLCGLLPLLSVVTQPVLVGVGLLVTASTLIWAVVRRGGLLDVGGGVVLVVGAAVATVAVLPENLPVLLVVVGAAAAGGSVARAGDEWARSSRRLADDREAWLRAGAERAVRIERLAVARELHDVVSHAVGLMTVQAGAAAAQLPCNRQRARVALDRVLATAADTVGELSRLLIAVEGSPLGGGTVPSDRYGQALRALVDRMGSAGLDVHLDADEVPAGDAGAAVHRVVQESLTNALRHSPGAHVVVRVDTRPEVVIVDIEDDGPGPGPQAPSGYGLVGIAERVHQLGGELSTGTHAGGSGFAVHVRLPLTAGQPS